MKNKKTKIALIAVLLTIILVCVYSGWQNSAIEITEYTICNSKIPSDFDGFRIVQISDLHNATFGKDNGKLLDKIKDISPDIICITGDIIDSRNTDAAVALKFVTQALKIAPCYYVTGNHEQRVSEYSQLKQKMQNVGVFVLENKKDYIYKGAEYIVIAGITEPSFETEKNFNQICDKNIKSINIKKDDFVVLLSHRPELFATYVLNKIDLVLTGHAHGGQIRLPYFGGIYAPGQGAFPEYDAGTFEKDGTTMIVSRGLGNSIFPVRVNNRPEIVLIELNKG